MNAIEKISGINLYDLGQPEFWVAVLSIILIDLVLSGDNAIMIAMACRNLAPKQQMQGIIWGTAGAIFLRLTFASLAVFIMRVPFIQFIGGLVLIWIAIKLVKEEKNNIKVDSPKRLWAAVRTIIIADAVMSLDNILALAGASHGKPGLLWFGLAVSIPLVVYGSRILIRIMNKAPWLNIAGAAVIGWTAGQMIIEDPTIYNLLKNLQFTFLIDTKIVALLCTVSVIIGGLKFRANKTHSDVR